MYSIKKIYNTCLRTTLLYRIIHCVLQKTPILYLSQYSFKYNIYTISINDLLKTTSSIKRIIINCKIIIFLEIQSIKC